MNGEEWRMSIILDVLLLSNNNKRLSYCTLFSYEYDLLEDSLVVFLHLQCHVVELWCEVDFVLSEKRTVAKRYTKAHPGTNWIVALEVGTAFWSNITLLYRVVWNAVLSFLVCYSIVRVIPRRWSIVLWTIFRYWDSLSIWFRSHPPLPLARKVPYRDTLLVSQSIMWSRECTAPNLGVYSKSNKLVVLKRLMPESTLIWA